VSLLDKNQNYYFTEKKWKNLDSHNIYDELGKIIGKVEFPLANQISILEPNKKLVCNIFRKGKIFPKYEMTDSKENQNLVFKIKKSGKLEKRNIRIEKNKDLILEAKISGHWGLDISDKKGNKIGAFARLDHAFMPTQLNLDLENAYGFQTIDESYDKKILSGFFIVILDSISESFFVDKLEKYFHE